MSLGGSIQFGRRRPSKKRSRTLMTISPLRHPAALPEPRRISVFGATGSVGSSTLDLIGRSPERYRIEALTACRNAGLLAEQARRFGARLAVIADPGAYKALRHALSGTGIEIAAGPEALVEAAERSVDWTMAAIVGAAGVPATMAAVRRGGVVAFANKETLVCAGELMAREIARHGATLLPVDSEHSAIFQVLDMRNRSSVDRIILTASGGPFRQADLASMRTVAPEAALAHPTWQMGAKISIDSATMMNKGLEIIEAHYLFQLPEESIEIVVHPQSVIHSMVAYVDGSILAQLGTPDMRTPIAVALAWPDRMAAPVERLDLARVQTLTFEEPDPVRFPALRLAREALRAGGGAPTILNAANEVAVRLFLDRRIGFLDIVETVERTLQAMPHRTIESLEQVFDLDSEARRLAEQLAIR